MITFYDRTDTVLKKIKRQERLALALATEQIKAEVQMLKRPPDVITGFYRATFHSSGQALNISGEGKERTAVVSGKPKPYNKSKEVIACDLQSGADYAGHLEFRDFSQFNGKWKSYGVLMPIRRAAVLAIPKIDKIFNKYLSNLK